MRIGSLNRRSLLRTNRTTDQAHLKKRRARTHDICPELEPQNTRCRDRTVRNYAESYYAEPYHEAQILCAQIRGTLVDRIRVSTAEILTHKASRKKVQKLLQMNPLYRGHDCNALLSPILQHRPSDGREHGQGLHPHLRLAGNSAISHLPRRRAAHEPPQRQRLRPHPPHDAEQENRCGVTKC